MKIGLISDTHDKIGHILRAVKVFQNRNVDIVLHAGDFVSSIAIEAFAGVKLVGVLGNNDTDVRGLTLAFNKIHGDLNGEIFETLYDGLKFAVYHGTNIARKEGLINSGKYDVFVYGHTHRRDNRIIGTTKVINPGTAKGLFFGFFASVALFDTSSRNLEFISL
jgi:uncharacterized protein